jgi:hypothetical protein
MTRPVGAEARETGTDARDPLAQALLPVLLHRLNNSTQVLASLNSLLAVQERERVLEQRAGDISWAAGSIDELGWLLAVLASACGSDLLLERRERDGLRIVFAAVREALRRAGRDLADGDRELPLLAADVADGWQLPWAMGSWVWTAGSVLPQGTRLAWTLRASGARHELACTAPDAPSLGALVQRVERLLPGAQAGCTAGAPDAQWILSVPSAWLTAGKRARGAS